MNLTRPQLTRIVQFADANPQSRVATFLGQLATIALTKTRKDRETAFVVFNPLPGGSPTLMFDDPRAARQALEILLAKIRDQIRPDGSGPDAAGPVLCRFIGISTAASS